MWRELTEEEMNYLSLFASNDEFDVVYGFNTNAYYVIMESKNEDIDLLFGYFDTEEDAWNWVERAGYLDDDVQCAVDYDMDI